MRLVKGCCAPGKTGFFFDDQRAIKNGAEADGAAYRGVPMTPGFTAVRQAGESISVLLLLEDGQIAHGDCAAVQYSGTGGRDPLFLARDFIPVIEQTVFPWLAGRDLSDFRRLSDELEQLTVNGFRLHTAIRYGVSQALLDAAAKSAKRQMCQVLSDVYGLELVARPVPIFTQSGDDRYTNADKMILKQAQVLPHGLINQVRGKLGEHGEDLLAYVAWLSNRIQELRPDDQYRPVLHLDVYGTIGLVFGPDNDRAIVAYLERLTEAARPFHLRIEGPVDLEERGRQIDAMQRLTRRVDERGIPVELVADEWCNTLEDIRLFAREKAGHMIQSKTPDLGGIANCVEAVRCCRRSGVGAYLGGTCNETDRSAQVCVHVAMAARPDQMLAKPGMGVDEGYMIVYNEMQRILALLQA
ncbi:MAG: methylaspartate ammonia-lyase [Clostridiaceae bacterium]|nr:methylaspartate ammonia-lyase [Clostridiaceae bacterium]